jgi:hypothetical protein
MCATKRLMIEFDQLEWAMNDTMRDINDYYLDTETGEVYTLPAELVEAARSAEESDALPAWELDLLPVAEAVADGDPRFVRVPEGDPTDAWELISQFIGTVEDEQVAGALADAARGRGAFARFKAALRRHPQIEERWFEFESAHAGAAAREWLASLSIEPVEGAADDPDADDGALI